MKVWHSVSEVLVSVENIKNIYETTGTLPPVLVEAYAESLRKVSRGMVQRFYERLNYRCAKALVFFAEVQAGEVEKK